MKSLTGCDSAFFSQTDLNSRDAYTSQVREYSIYLFFGFVFPFLSVRVARKETKEEKHKAR